MNTIAKEVVYDSSSNNSSSSFSITFKRLAELYEGDDEDEYGALKPCDRSLGLND